MDINFHQTFKPEKAYISELLQIGDEAKDVTLDELSKMTGIPQGKSSGKLVPHIKYAQFMGLVNYSSSNSLYTLEPTSLGKTIADEDRSLSEDISLLAMHHNIIKKETGADLWSFCFIDYFNKYGKTSKYEYFLNEVEQKFGKVKLGPFLKSYEELFAPLSLLTINSKTNQMEFGNIECHRELIPVIGYIFYDLWDKAYPDESEITGDQLNGLYFKNRFGWTQAEELNFLDQLADYGLIRINKQLMPFTIIRLRNTQEVLSILYNELI